MRKTYLGDGLYATFDGYELVLKANSDESPTDTVYLDPRVTDELLEFIRRCRGECNNEED